MEGFVPSTAHSSFAFDLSDKLVDVPRTQPIIDCSEHTPVAPMRPYSLRIFSIAFPFANSSTNLSK